MKRNALLGAVMAGSLAVGALGSSAARMLGDGSDAHLVAFSCHVTSKNCTAEFRLTKDGQSVGEKQVRFGFDGKIKNERGRDIGGRVPSEVTSCMRAFRDHKFDPVVELK